MGSFDYERFFVKKPMRGYFESCLPSIPVKNDFVKKYEFTRKSVKFREFT
jgi:hypothetical protein